MALAIETVKTTTRRFEHRHTLATTSLACTQRPDGTCIVTWRMPAGETANDLPEVIRCKTVAVARCCWARLQRSIMGRGYAIAS
jgi:hypothetical protein